MPVVCRHCGHGRFYVDRERLYRSVCRCDGAYHWGTHRPGSPMCEQNLAVDVHRAKRQGCTAEEVLQLAADLAWDLTVHDRPDSLLIGPAQPPF